MTDTATTSPEGVLTYQIDPAHSRAHFSVRHLMIAHVRGEFTALSGTLKLNTAAPESSVVEVEIDVKSISTGVAQRDDHLRTADFFEPEKYPTIRFTSTSAERIGDGTGKLTGDLTMHGVTKSVTLDVEGSEDDINDLWGNLRRGYTAQTKIKRSDFGLTYNAVLEAGGVAIGDDVNITIDVQFVRPAA
ncbi:MAG: YceI family protein [Capsulimonadaceae bacterium]